MVLLSATLADANPTVLALAGVALVQSEVLHPLFGIVGLVLAPLFLLGSLEFVGPFEPRGWKSEGTPRENDVEAHPCAG